MQRADAVGQRVFVVGGAVAVLLRRAGLVDVLSGAGGAGTASTSASMRSSVTDASDTGS